MGLLKAVASPVSGQVAEYWRITSSTVHHSQPVVIEVAVNGYVTQAARNDGLRPIEYLHIRLALDDLGQGADIHALTTAQLYEGVMALMERSQPALESPPLTVGDATSLARAGQAPGLLAGAERA